MPPAPPPSLFRRAWVRRAAVLAAMAAVALFAFRDLILGTPVDVYEIGRADLVQTVVASGRVVTPQRVAVSAVITGRVVRIPVEEGQQVRRGDVLIVLDDSDQRAALAQAKAAVAQAEARLRQLREVGLPAAEQALAQAQANLRLAQRQYERQQDLLAKGFVSRSAVDDAQRNLEVAQSQLAAARIQVESNRPTGSDTLLAQAALEQARAAANVAQARLDQTVITAPVAGTLIGRDVEPGNVVQPGRELMTLAPAGETQVVVQIDEKNLSQLELGQRALGSADAYPGERFAAELVYVNPGIDALRGSVEVKLRVDAPPAYLRQDMTVSVDIEVARRANVLVAPADAVFDAASREPWVLTLDGLRAARRPVKLGIRGEGRVEIVAGIAAGERVIAASGGTIRPGQRVHAANVTRIGAS